MKPITAVALMSMLLGTSATEAAAKGAPLSAPTVARLSSYFGLTKGGAAVTITGSGFKGVSLVTFGTTAVTFTVVSSSTIAVTAPPHEAGQVDVRVTVGTAVSAAGTADVFVFHAQAPAGATVAIGTYVPEVYICQSGSTCHPIASTVANFTDPVTCRVTNSDIGPIGPIWTQGPNSTKGTGIVYSGKSIEVTCDGVVARRST